MATDADTRDFHEQLKAILPRLRVYALSLTRDRDAADDLVHDTVVKALTGRASFEPGTNLSAWVFRIQRNEFISGLRRLRPSLEGQSYEVIAAHTGVSVGTVKSRISRARDTLERLLLEGESTTRPPAGSEHAPRASAATSSNNTQDRR